MSSVIKYIGSGILEAYIEGRVSPGQAAEVEAMASLHANIRDRLDQLSRELEIQMTPQAATPPAYVKSLVMATINYMERMSQGEILSDPPILHSKSQPGDYAQWLERSDFTRPDTIEGMHIRIIRQRREVTTAVVWMQEMAAEVHDREIEQFLIVEGACTVSIGHITHYLKVGDRMKIPAGQPHRAVSTGAIPCKIILQRIAVPG